MVTHIYNPSLSGESNLEDHGWRPSSQPNQPNQQNPSYTGAQEGGLSPMPASCQKCKALYEKKKKQSKNTWGHVSSGTALP
jgi:hypothetical protein